MSKHPSQTRVTNEVGYCSFCGRARNLRREERRLGDLVRTIVTCESCHRNLTSSMEVAGADSDLLEPAPSTGSPTSEITATPPAAESVQAPGAGAKTSTRRAPKR